ncbi:DUF4198 domain-containing protein [Alkalibacillus haloalkaliphilus]|uniref:DUF4198 domain-containing protein n=1 Tax=Alkalibacillus haloalkaliphilus TaxID=94136 RepID=A0A511W6T5_9BACI|nr:DUF4198 domain-containing protein [Alkalibacillus haloalkaliphilus]GEN45062.1 hypothetical protein AHA02nite_08380 [Alkalibacillus haloalkaliphilus]
MSKKFMSVSVAFLLILLSSITTFAHNGWIESNNPMVETSQNAYVSLYLGNHSDQHTSYRIDRNWGIQDSKIVVKTPSNEEVNVTDEFYYMGEVSEVDDDRAGLNNFYNGSFTVEEEGLYTVIAKGDFKYGEQEKATVRTAKSFIGAKENPTLSEMNQLTGFDEPQVSNRGEIVPLFNPLTVQSGDYVTAQLMFDGEPVEDEEVAVIQRSTSKDLQLVTDLNGKIAWETADADYYLIRAEFEQDGIEYEATMTFVVNEEYNDEESE